MAKNQTDNPWFGILFSALGFLVSWILGLIPYPYVGVICALIFQPIIGGFVGLLTPSRWNLFFITLSTMGGFTLGFIQGRYNQKGESPILWMCVATFVALSLFFVFYRMNRNYIEEEDAENNRE